MSMFCLFSKIKEINLRERKIDSIFFSIYCTAFLLSVPWIDFNNINVLEVCTPQVSTIKIH